SYLKDIRFAESKSCKGIIELLQQCTQRRYFSIKEKETVILKRLDALHDEIYQINQPKARRYKLLMNVQ
ncbi:MAG: hypothetical protein MK132_16845, partial [Lentisphaerales bacterium]|nr:hypothetical protein [Lentisphaerales bacterium]